MSAPAAQRGASRQASHTGNSRGECLQACHTGCSRGACRQARHAGGHAGRATQSRPVRAYQRHPARNTAHSTSSRRRNVEHAARLAMPAVTPAEQHTPELHGSSNCHPPPRLAPWPARLRPPPPAAEPCRGRPSCPPPLFPSPCPPCPPWFVFSVPSVSSVVCLLRALPTPSHNLPQTFFPFLFNHFPTPPFSFSCSPLVC